MSWIFVKDWRNLLYYYYSLYALLSWIIFRIISRFYEKLLFKKPKRVFIRTTFLLKYFHLFLKNSAWINKHNWKLVWKVNLNSNLLKSWVWLRLWHNVIWRKVFKNWPSKIFQRLSFTKFTWSILGSKFYFLIFQHFVPSLAEAVLLVTFIGLFIVSISLNLNITFLKLYLFSFVSKLTKFIL